MKKIVNWSLVVFIAITIGTGLYLFGKLTVKPVEVYREVEVIKEVESKAPVLDRIYKCESGGKHIALNGQVVLNANTNGSVDVGIAQINNSLWGKKATELGLNLFIEADNIKMAQWLYKNYGTEPWVWSKACWNK